MTFVQRFKYSSSKPLKVFVPLAHCICMYMATIILVIANMAFGFTLCKECETGIQLVMTDRELAVQLLRVRRQSDLAHRLLTAWLGAEVGVPGPQVQTPLECSWHRHMVSLQVIPEMLAAHVWVGSLTQLEA